MAAAALGPVNSVQSSESPRLGRAIVAFEGAEEAEEEEPNPHTTAASSKKRGRPCRSRSSSRQARAMRAWRRRVAWSWPWSFLCLFFCFLLWECVKKGDGTPCDAARRRTWFGWSEAAETKVFRAIASSATATMELEEGGGGRSAMPGVYLEIDVRARGAYDLEHPALVCSHVLRR